MDHAPHPHIEKRKQYDDKPSGFNNWLAVKITNVVGTMWCAYAFTIIALISLPDAIKGGEAPLSLGSRRPFCNSSSYRSSWLVKKWRLRVPINNFSKPMMTRRHYSKSPTKCISC